MLIFREYNEEKKLDRAWFKSSNVFYSECEDRVNELKVLRVTFNNGATYEYSDVDVNDYVMFLAGGLENSHGKALNEFVKKKKCPYVKLENKSTENLLKEMEKLKEEKILLQEAQKKEES
jgi:hypothetical protein